MNKIFWEFYGYLLFISIGILLGMSIMMSSCAMFGPKVYKTSDFVEYDGPLSGNYRSSDDMVRIYGETLACAQITVPIPPPNLRVYGCPEFADCEVDGVQCGEKVMAGCYEAGTNKLVLPANSKAEVIEHAMIHHLCNHIPELNCSAIESQERHTSELFDRCSGLRLMK